MIRLCLLSALLSLFCVIFFAQNTNAISEGIVISQVQLGDATSAKNEFVEIYNNSDSDIEITNWCLYYLSSGLTSRKMACFVPENISFHIFLPSHSTAMAVTNELTLASVPINGDIKFSYTLSGTAGYVKLVDDLNLEVDRVGWGLSTPEVDLIIPPPVGSILSRKIVLDEILQDTDINSDDFEITAPRKIYTYGFVYDLIDICLNIDGIQQSLPIDYIVDEAGNCGLIPIDLCNNIAGIQAIVPNGFLLDENKDCLIDICLNLDGLQQILSEDMDLDADGNCTPHDECVNLVGIQEIIPDGYKIDDDSVCLLDLMPLKITELLPNVDGIDDGKEFIEIYNPNSVDIDLGNYVFYLGLDEKKSFSFPEDIKILANQYLAFYNSEIEFTLPNTSSSVRLESIDGKIIDQTLVYDSPKENFAWAVIDGLWQYTDRPTPGSANLVSAVKIVPEIVTETEVEAEEAIVVNELKPCAANQYRNSDTNRCRMVIISTSESVLAPCKDGQYRSEETNRCRNIVADVVAQVPCDEGEERNLETNRCRKIVATVTAILGSTTELKPCDEGEERNPDTNRCRKIVSSVVPAADFAPEQTFEASNNYILWWSLGGVGAVAITYGIWEWRKEIVKLFQKFNMLFVRNK